MNDDITRIQEHPFADTLELFEEHLYQDPLLLALDSAFGLSRLTPEQVVAQVRVCL